MGKLNRRVVERGGSGPVRGPRGGLRPPMSHPKKELVVGRSRKVRYNYQQVKDALTHCKGMVTYAAKQLGTTYDNLKSYIKENPKLNTHIESLMEERLDRAELILNDLLEKDKTALIFFLKTQGKKRGYIEDEKVDMSKLAQPITFIYQAPPPEVINVGHQLTLPDSDYQTDKEGSST